MKRIAIFAALILTMCAAHAQVINNPDAIERPLTKKQQEVVEQNNIAAYARQRAAYAYSLSPRPGAVTLTYLLGISDNPSEPWNGMTEAVVLELTRKYAPGCMRNEKLVLGAWRELAATMHERSSMAYGGIDFRLMCNEGYRLDGGHINRLMDGIKLAADTAFYHPIQRHNDRLAAGVPIYDRNNPAPIGHARIQHTEQELTGVEAKLKFAASRPDFRYSNNLRVEQLRHRARICQQDLESSQLDGGPVAPSCIRLLYSTR